MAVATKDVRPYHVNVGIPAKSIRIKPNAPPEAYVTERVAQARADGALSLPRRRERWYLSPSALAAWALLASAFIGDGARRPPRPSSRVVAGLAGR